MTVYVEMIIKINLVIYVIKMHLFSDHTSRKNFKIKRVWTEKVEMAGWMTVISYIVWVKPKYGKISYGDYKVSKQVCWASKN